MRRIAHLSDVHTLAGRPGRSRKSDWSVRFLSLGRPLDAGARIGKLRRALAAARRAGAEHYVISGDLTESGELDQYAAFGDAVRQEVSPDQVTLVPGNHDVYSSEDAWRRALDGPLRDFAETSATTPGKVVDRGEVIFLPLDVTRHQPITRSGGALTEDAARALEKRLRDRTLARDCVVVVQHHPPYAHPVGAWQWIDGLEGWKRQAALLDAFPMMQVLHGHLHRATDRAHGSSPMTRVFGAAAIVEETSVGGAPPSVRLYEAKDGALQSAGMLHA